MTSSDNTEAFLQVMVNMQMLTASDAAQSITKELHALKKRDRQNCTLIERFKEENHEFSQNSKAASDEKQALEYKVKGLTEEIDRVKQSLIDMNQMAEDCRRELREKSEKLIQMEQNMVGLTMESEDDAGTRWYKLWTSVHQLATTFFSVDLESGTMRDAHDWEPITNHQYRRSIPSPLSNSNEAKQMRIVAVASVIASALTHHIFRAPFGIDSGFDAALSGLVRTDPDMESFYRSSHLAVVGKLSEYRASVLNRTVGTAVKEILTSVYQILPVTKTQEFRVELEDVCRIADKDWQAMQRYKERYEVDMDGDERFYERVPLWRPVGAESRKTNGAAKTLSPRHASNGQKAEYRSPAEGRAKSAAVVTSVWPLLRVVGAAGTVRIISGWALFSDQTREAEEQVLRENRRVGREENRQDKRKGGPSPISLGKFLPGSPKST